MTRGSYRLNAYILTTFVAALVRGTFLDENSEIEEIDCDVSSYSPGADVINKF